MEIITKSGIVRVNKRSNYGKWLIGYTSTGAWTGGYTIRNTWENNKEKKPKGCSWTAWGAICGQFINPLYKEVKEKTELIEELKEDWKKVKPLLEEAKVELPKGLYIDCLDEIT